MRTRTLATAAWLALATIFATSSLADAGLPSLDSPELGHGPGAYMHMLLQKTFLRINVATIEVRVDKATQGRLAGMVKGQTYSEGLAAQLANTAIAAPSAVVQMKFKRDVSLSRWMDVVRENLEQARKAGLIDTGLEQKVGKSLPEWFAALKSRGYEKNDRLIYGVTPNSLRTVVVSASGQVLVDRSENDQGSRRVVMASYFASGSEFREPLLRSLFETGK